MILSGVTLGDRYTIEREIGRGGMATVWLANDRQHGRRVAIKTLHPELAGAIGIDRFLREIRLTAELQHPAVVPILDSGSVERDGMRLPWYAMPFLDGESLRQRLNRETQLPIDEALRIVTAVGKALSAAHDRNIVHRDIKPENIFLSGDHVYVVDFGVAKAVADTEAERLTSTGLAIGTPTYMSPEQALAGPVDARSDQYSLAVVLYEMLAGEPPFAGPNQQATIARRLAERARPITTVRSTVSPAIEHATLRALERTPADRFPSVNAFLSALRDDRQHVPVTSRQLRAGVALVAIVAIAIAVVAAWKVWWPRGTDPAVIALYERGVREYDRRTQAGITEAISTLGSAIRLDSSFAPAWNALAKAYVRAYERGFHLPDIPTDGLLPLAVKAVERSVNLDRSNADAWMTRGIVAQQLDPTNVPAALRWIEQSLQLDSTLATTWHFYAIMHAALGKLDLALEGWRRSVRLNPAYTQGLTFLGLGHYWSGKYDSAAVWTDSAIRVDETYLLARQTAALVAIERGDMVVAEDQARTALRLAEGVEEVNSQAILALVKASAGQRNMAQVDLLVAEVVAGKITPTPSHTAVYLAEAFAALGNIDGALKALGTYATPRDMHFQLHLRCSPTFSPLENDPRFRAMLVIPRPPRGSHC
jgi:tRNA A-37 threonylcarbamoyl transferase component Bud32/tetratricopeptide (TPR) repeat protein